jgi:23S rRNA (guanosine2251-2'-O)-methyltransferase
VGEEIDGITNLSKNKKVPIQLVPKEKLEDVLYKNKLADANHQGVIAFIPMIEYASMDDIIKSAEDKGEPPFILILDSITDVHNFGAIARSAESLGAHGIIIQQSGSAPINPVAVKVSAGALMNIPVCREQSIITVIKYLRAHGLRILGADVGQAKQVFEEDFTLPIAVVFGAEGEGITPIIKKFCDGLVAIPMVGKTESLNVSVSAGIVLYEAMQQRKIKK